MGPKRERPGDADALLLAAGERGGIVVPLVFQADLPEQLHAELFRPVTFGIFFTTMSDSVDICSAVLFLNRL